MDSGLGSDDDRKQANRGTTKEQKQLHNQLLSSGAGSATACAEVPSDVSLPSVTADQRRIEERRQGALLFHRSLPQQQQQQHQQQQFSLHMMREDNNNFPSLTTRNMSLTPFAPETDTPYNSIERIGMVEQDVEEDEEGETVSVRRSPLGFYVDLSQVTTEANSVPSSSTTKNIFSMVIDFEAAKKDKPVKLTSSLAVHRKNLAKHKLQNKTPKMAPKLNAKDMCRLNSSTSSINSSMSTASTSKKESKSEPEGNNIKKSNENVASFQSISSNSTDSTSSECIAEKEGLAELEKTSFLEDEQEKAASEIVGEMQNMNSSSGYSDANEESNHTTGKPNSNKSQGASQFVRLSDLERQQSRITTETINFSSSAAPSMSRSIPESSWLESPILMCHSLGFRSAPHPLAPENHPGDNQENLDQFGPESSEVSEERPKRFRNKLGTDLLRMFLEEIGPDVEVDVEGRKLKAHKCILASRCQYFAALLSGDWLQKNGNVISLKGFSYESVYFSLCHIYSGTMHVPDSISLVELASLADMLCLEGLKEVVERALRLRHCHNFHQPCAGCCTGVLEVLPLSAAYGLEDLYRKCLQWIAKNFVRVWPSRAFASLPRELREKCYRQHVVHMTPEKVLETRLSCDKIIAALPLSRWVEPVSRLALQLSDACLLYLRQHYSAVLGSSYFISLDADNEGYLEKTEDQMLSAVKNLGIEQACRAYSRCCKMLEQNWNKPFVDLLIKIKIQLEQCLVRQSDKLIRSNAWLRLDTSLRNRIKELTPNFEPASRLPRATPLRSTASTTSVKSPTTKKANHPNNSSVSSSDSSRNSSPGINQKNRPNATNGTTTSLRRSLLLAAKAPQVPPSPSMQRRSTLTQPTAASTAKAAVPRNVKVQRKEPKAVQQQYPPSSTKRVSTVKRTNNAAPSSSSTSSSANVSRKPSFGRREEPNQLYKTKPDSRATSPLKSMENKKLSSPFKVVEVKRSVSSSKSPSETKKVSSPRRTESSVTSPMNSNSAAEVYQVGSPERVNDGKEVSAEGSEGEPKMRRSSTFLKDEPTVLGKIL